MNKNKDFYTREDESIEGRTRMASLHGKEKWTYFKTYYLKKMLLLIALLVVIIAIVLNIVQSRNDVSIYIAVVEDELNEEEVLLMETEFITYLNSERYDMELFIDHVYVTDTSLLDLKMGMGGVDLLIAEESFHANYPEGYYKDLEMVLSKETLEKVADYLCYQENEDGVSYVYGVNLKNCKKYQAILPKIENPILAIPITVKDVEFTSKFIEYLWED